MDGRRHLAGPAQPAQRHFASAKASVPGETIAAEIRLTFGTPGRPPSGALGEMPALPTSACGTTPRKPLIGVNASRCGTSYWISAQVN